MWEVWLGKMQSRNGAKRMQRTLLLIKPNVFEDRQVGAVIDALERKGLVIRKMKMETLSRNKAEGFYAIHRGKPFFERLVEFMTSGPIVEMVLEHENAVEYVREVIGSTDPAQAAEGTIRRKFARSLTENAVHASDSVDNARHEIDYMFGE
jgi:nucleoside-diphosphate kinase